VTDSAAVALVRRYAEATDRAGLLFDMQVPHATMVARSSSAYPKFQESARARLSRLADHLDQVGGEWRKWRWLVDRSYQDALGFLALAEWPARSN